MVSNFRLCVWCSACAAARQPAPQRWKAKPADVNPHENLTESEPIPTDQKHDAKGDRDRRDDDGEIVECGGNRAGSGADRSDVSTLTWV